LRVVDDELYLWMRDDRRLEDRSRRAYCEEVLLVGEPRRRARSVVRIGAIRGDIWILSDGGVW
jgi:hypothetical protein